MKFKIFTLCGALLLMTGCSFEYTQKPTQEGIEVENIAISNYFETGPNKQYFTKIPSRVLVIGASQTETLLDLEVADSILAAVKYEDNIYYPIREVNQKAFQNLHFISRQELNLEGVLKLAPDMIISEESWFTKGKLLSTDYWNKKGVHTMVTLSTTAPRKVNKPETLENEMKYILDLGRIYHKETQAQKITTETMNRINEIHEKAIKLPKQKVMILDLLSVTTSYGRNKIAGNIASHLGADISATTAVVNDEFIMKENPDVVFVITYGDYKTRLPLINNKPAFQNLNFIKNKRLYPIPLKYAYGPMTRSIDAADYMAERIWPGEFSFEKEYNFHDHTK